MNKGQLRKRAVGLHVVLFCDRGGGGGGGGSGAEGAQKTVATTKVVVVVYQKLLEKFMTSYCTVPVKIRNY